MKRSLLIIFSAILVLALAACSNTQPPVTASAPSQSEAAKSQTAAPQSTESEQTQAPAYSFEFEDVNGKLHKLSDYAGKPVFLEIWGTWCGVCVSSLPDLDEFAGEPHDFAVLSVVSPGASGELSKEDFIEWYKEQGLENLTVLIDEDWQIISDFGVTAYPSQIIFDANGAVVTGFAGLLPKDFIVEIMDEVAKGTYGG
ncbi:MAG: redoxin domain-containing protein [Burkholderiales bacterium]